jgi:hypothetical protein
MSSSDDGVIISDVAELTAELRTALNSDDVGQTARLLSQKGHFEVQAGRFRAAAYCHWQDLLLSAHDAEQLCTSLCNFAPAVSSLGNRLLSFRASAAADRICAAHGLSLAPVGLRALYAHAQEAAALFDESLVVDAPYLRALSGRLLATLTGPAVGPIQRFELAVAHTELLTTLGDLPAAYDQASELPRLAPHASPADPPFTVRAAAFRLQAAVRLFRDLPEGRNTLLGLLSSSEPLTHAPHAAHAAPDVLLLQLAAAEALLYAISASACLQVLTRAEFFLSEHPNCSSMAEHVAAVKQQAEAVVSAGHAQTRGGNDVTALSLRLSFLQSAGITGSELFSTARTLVELVSSAPRPRHLLRNDPTKGITGAVEVVRAGFTRFCGNSEAAEVAQGLFAQAAAFRRLGDPFNAALYASEGLGAAIAGLYDIFEGAPVFRCFTNPAFWAYHRSDPFHWLCAPETADLLSPSTPASLWVAFGEAEAAVQTAPLHLKRAGLVPQCVSSAFAAIFAAVGVTEVLAEAPDSHSLSPAAVRAVIGGREAEESEYAYQLSTLVRSALYAAWGLTAALPPAAAPTQVPLASSFFVLTASAFAALDARLGLPAVIRSGCAEAHELAATIKTAGEYATALIVTHDHPTDDIALISREIEEARLQAQAMAHFNVTDSRALVRLCPHGSDLAWACNAVQAAQVAYAAAASLPFPHPAAAFEPEYPRVIEPDMTPTEPFARSSIVAAGSHWFSAVARCSMPFRRVRPMRLPADILDAITAWPPTGHAPEPAPLTPFASPPGLSPPSPSQADTDTDTLWHKGCGRPDQGTAPPSPSHHPQHCSPSSPSDADFADLILSQDLVPRPANAPLASDSECSPPHSSHTPHSLSSPDAPEAQQAPLSAVDALADCGLGQNITRLARALDAARQSPSSGTAPSPRSVRVGCFEFDPSTRHVRILFDPPAEPDHPWLVPLASSCEISQLLSALARAAMPPLATLYLASADQRLDPRAFAAFVATLTLTGPSPFVSVVDTFLPPSGCRVIAAAALGIVARASTGCPHLLFMRVGLAGAVPQMLQTLRPLQPQGRLYNTPISLTLRSTGLTAAECCELVAGLADLGVHVVTLRAYGLKTPPFATPSLPLPSCLREVVFAAPLAPRANHLWGGSTAPEPAEAIPFCTWSDDCALHSLTASRFPSAGALLEVVVPLVASLRSRPRALNLKLTQPDLDDTQGLLAALLDAPAPAAHTLTLRGRLAHLQAEIDSLSDRYLSHVSLLLEPAALVAVSNPHCSSLVLGPAEAP